MNIFETKDELISKAIFYQIQSSVRRMAKAVEKEESFREKIYALMNYMDKKPLQISDADQIPVLLYPGALSGEEVYESAGMFREGR